MVDAFAKLLPSRLGFMLARPGEGIGGATLLSLSFDSPRFFGFEKSFIFDVLLFGSFSGGKPGGGAIG